MLRPEIGRYVSREARIEPGLVRSAGGRDFWGFRIRDRFLRLQLGDFQRLFYDPTWRIRYVIRRGSDGVEVDDGSAWSGSHPHWEIRSYEVEK